jgi:SPP1 gp7 family putative phage head morphogenesis protein
MGLMQYFKKSPTAQLAEAPSPEVAWSESTLYKGADFPKYNPDDLIGRKGYAVYGKMMLDEQVKAVVRFKRDAITSRDWDFELIDSSLSEDEIKLRKEVFVKAVEKMEAPFSDALNGIMSAMYNGFSITEKRHKQIIVDGKGWIGIKKLKLKPCDTFYFHSDEYGNIEKVTQKYENREQEIDIEKFIHFVQNPDYDEHYGRSELRECYRAWFSKDMIIKFQNIHLERFAAGFVWAEMLNGKSLVSGSTEFETLKSVMQNLQATSSIIMPKDVKLNIEHPASTDAFERAVSQHDKSIAKALLVPNLMGISEQGSTGSYSQSQTQMEAFIWTLDADATRLEAVLNTQLFKEIGDKNFGDDIYPQFKFKPVSDSRKLEIVKIWTQLVTAGAVQSTDADEAHLRTALEIPQKPIVEGEDPAVVLNGAQLQSLVSIVSQVGAGTLSAESAKALIVAVFPVTSDQAAAIIDSAKIEQPKEPAGEIDKLPIDGEEGKPKDRPKDQPKEETIIGKMGISVSAFSKAMKRCDFTVIESKAENAVTDNAYEIAVLNSEAVARLVALAEELKLGTAEGNPDDIRKIVYTPAEVSKIKSAANKALTDAWTIGESHGKKEIAKAGSSMGRTFATNDLALQDLASKYLKSRAYTLAGDISNATQKKIQSILSEGIKVSKTPEEVKREIYKALEADGMLTEEAVVDALGASTVKQANARIETAIRTTSFEAVNEARYNFFSDPALNGFVEALEYSAILDDRTTEICSQLDGETYGIDSEVWSTFRPPNHFNCRSLLIPITINDTWTESDPPTINPQKGFGFTRGRKQWQP